MSALIVREVRRILQQDARVGIILAEILGPPPAVEDTRVRLWEGDDD